MDDSNSPVRQIGDVTVVTVGRVERIDELLDGGLAGLFDGTGKKVILDLSPAEFLQADFMGHLVRAYQHTRNGPDRLRVCCGPGAIREVFRIVRLDQMVPVSATLQEALNGF